MKKKITLLCVLSMTLNIPSITFAEISNQNVPTWAYEMMNKLVASGIVRTSVDETNQLTREEMAMLVAKALLRMENISSNQHESNISTVQSVGSITKLLASMEELNYRDQIMAKSLKKEYDEEIKSLDSIAMDLAKLEIKNNRSAKNEKLEKKYTELLGRISITTNELTKVNARLALQNSSLVQLQLQRKEALDKLISNPEMVGTSDALDVTQSINLGRLQAEFASELKNLGYFCEEKAKRQLETGTKAKVNADEQLKVNGEIRYNYAFNHGVERFKNNDSKLRARVYFDYNVDNNWHAYSMLESEKGFLGNSSADSKVKGERWYMQGKNGAMDLTVGSFGYAMAEGNIYDSTFKGIQTEFGDLVKYKVGYGKLNEVDKAYMATARYQDYDYNVEGGVYRFQVNDGEKRTIWTMAGNYDFENFMLGAMYLKGNSSVKDGNGYVLTLSHGKLKTWLPGTYNLYAKYYNQSAATYIEHTMTGLGQKMHGFKGYSGGVYYTIRENLVAGLEYYNLEDKITGETGQTLWSQITYYF